MPLTLLIVSIILVLVTIVGGIIACVGVNRAQDGFEDEEGFHTLAAPASPGGEVAVRSEQADAAGAGI